MRPVFKTEVRKPWSGLRVNFFFVSNVIILQNKSDYKKEIIRVKVDRRDQFFEVPVRMIWTTAKQTTERFRRSNSCPMVSCPCLKMSGIDLDGFFASCNLKIG